MTTLTTTTIDIARNPLAACKALEDPRVMFPEDQEQHDAAVAVCATCPIADACLAAALAEEGRLRARDRFGVRGGWGAADRARMARGRPTVDAGREANGRPQRARSVRTGTCRICGARFEQHGPGPIATSCPPPAPCRARAADSYWRTRPSRATPPAPCPGCGAPLAANGARRPELCDACAPPRLVAKRRSERAARARAKAAQATGPSPYPSPPPAMATVVHPPAAGIPRPAEV